MTRRSPLKFLVFALAPTLALALAAEAALRVKYFLQNGRDWHYITTPFGSFRNVDAAPAASLVGPWTPRAISAHGQMVFEWQKPCEDRTVYSVALARPMPRTWDANCFRGDRVSGPRQPGEYRIFFMGGSTVEDAQSDEEMMTAQFKRALRPRAGRRLAVVNAGHAGLDSLGVLQLYTSKVSALSPDLVIYYEAWNEQPAASTFGRADAALAKLKSSRIHRALYYRSLLYTYVLEKYEFAASAKAEAAIWRRARFWKIDTGALREHFSAFAHRVTDDGATLVFVTQVIDWPRMWKGIDTFDYAAVDRLLDRLRADDHYAYDVQEISALNQRLAVAYTIALCDQLHVRVVDIRGDVESLGDRGRREMFLDLGHRTVKGNAVVGTLIADTLAAIVE